VMRNGRGMTLYIGSRESDRCMRVYDEHGPVRVELECKGDVAQSVGQRLLLMEKPEDWGGLIVGMLAEFIDFRTPWWAAFVAGVCRVRVEVTKAGGGSVERVAAWLRRQVAPSLALIVAAAGGNLGVVDALVSDGRRRMRPAQWALARAGS